MTKQNERPTGQGDERKDKFLSERTKANPFSYRDIYRDPSKILLFQESREDDISNKGIFVFDANTLLIPFSARQHSLEEIEKVLEKLKLQSRVRVPAQALREFTIHRSDKIKDIYSQLSRQRNISISMPITNILDNTQEYVDLLSKKAVIDENIKEYRRLVDNVLELVKSWFWKDPVSEIYSKIFDVSTIIDTDKTDDFIIADAQRRDNDKIPPGYKDSHKEQNPYGDLIIWHSMLELAKLEEKPIIFVSSDEKPDWWLRSENSPVFPRYELIYEFRRETNQNFYIMKLSEVMSIMKADRSAVLDVKNEEVTFVTNDVINLLNEFDIVSDVRKVLNIFLYDRITKSHIVNTSDRITISYNNSVKSLHIKYFDTGLLGNRVKHASDNLRDELLRIATTTDLYTTDDDKKSFNTLILVFDSIDKLKTFKYFNRYIDTMNFDALCLMSSEDGVQYYDAVYGNELAIPLPIRRLFKKDAVDED